MSKTYAGYTLPNQEERRAGMAAFRAKLRKAHARLAEDQRLSEQDRAFQRSLVATIDAAALKHNDARYLKGAR